MPSFDVVSAADMQEVRNAVDQVSREIQNRYDFKDSKSTVNLEETLIKVMADDDMKLTAIQGLIKERLAKRGVSPKLVEFKDPAKAGGDMLRQEVAVRQGLKEDELKKINKAVKAKKMKVQAQIQGDKLRVSGKKRDDLQTVISFLKDEFGELDLQFENFRD